MNFKLSIRTGKSIDLSDSERSIVLVGLIIPETADLLRFSHTSTSRVYREWPEKESSSSLGENASKCFKLIGKESNNQPLLT